MSKKLLTFTVLLIFIVAIEAACAAKLPNPTADSPLVLTMAEPNPSDSISGKMDIRFKEAVYELSEGSMIIDLYTDSILGNENQVLDNMFSDNPTIDLYRAAAFSLTPYGATDWSLLTLPYTFASKEHFWNFVNSDLGVKTLLEPHEKGLGVRGLFFGEEGFRHFFTVGSCKSINDLQGLNIRVNDDPLTKELIESLGATPVNVPFPDISSAIKTGKIDGAEQPIVNYNSNNFSEVAPNMILDGHTLGITSVIITDKCWDSLTSKQQSILIDAGKIASDYCREISDSTESEIIRSLKVKGVSITEVDDITPWQDACSDLIISKTSSKFKLYNDILALNQ